MNVRRRNATIVAGLLLSCSLLFGGWTQLNPGIMGGVYTNVYFLPGQTLIGFACGTGLDTNTHLPTGLIIKTTDGGTSWLQKVSGTPNILKSIYFSDASTGYACGLAGTLVKTTDGGESWAASASGIHTNDQLNYVSFPSNGQTGYIGVQALAESAHVYKTTNGAASWTFTRVGGVISQANSCGMATDDIGVAMGPNQFCYTTTDGFGTGKFTDAWAPYCELVAAAYSHVASNRAYVVGNDTALDLGIIRYTTTGGDPHWDSVRCYPVASFSCVDYASPETAYVGGADGNILGSYTPTDFWKTNTGVTNAINGIHFPNGPDTGYAAAGPILLKTIDAGIPWVQGVAEGKAPATVLTGIRVVSNPGRFGIALRSDANVTVTVFDAAGRAVLTTTANQGLNLLPIRKAGAYFVKSGEHTARAVVTD